MENTEYGIRIADCRMQNAAPLNQSLGAFVFQGLLCTEPNVRYCTVPAHEWHGSRRPHVPRSPCGTRFNAAAPQLPQAAPLWLLPESPRPGFDFHFCSLPSQETALREHNTDPFHSPTCVKRPRPSAVSKSTTQHATIPSISTNPPRLTAIDLDKVRHRVPLQSTQRARDGGSLQRAGGITTTTNGSWPAHRQARRRLARCSSGSSRRCSRPRTSRASRAGWSTTATYLSGRSCS